MVSGFMCCLKLEKIHFSSSAGMIERIGGPFSMNSDIYNKTPKSLNKGRWTSSWFLKTFHLSSKDLFSSSPSSEMKKPFE